MLVLMLAGMLTGDSPFFKGTVKQVLEKAKAEKKMVVVDVYTTWCGPCKLMDKTTFSDKDVVELLTNKVIAYKIDAEKGEGIKLARKYRVAGYPCILILNGDGKLVDRQMGYLPPRYFLNWVNTVL